MADKIKNGISPHPEIITIQQKFSIPVACLVFALVGLALGMSVARDGKLAGLRRRDRGHLRLLHRVPAGRIPDQGLLRQPRGGQERRPLPGGAHGPLGAQPHARPVRHGRADLAGPLHGRAAPPARARRHPSPARLAWRQSRTSASSAGVRSKQRPRVARRARGGDPHPPSTVPLPAPHRPLHQPHLPPDRRPVVHGAARALLHLDVHRQVGEDLQGPGDDRNRHLAAGLHDPAVRLLRDSHCGAAERARHVRPAVAQQRADGDEGLRRQPLPRRRLGSPAVAGVQRSPVRPRAEGPGPARTAAPTCSTPRSAAGRPACSTP